MKKGVAYEQDRKQLLIAERQEILCRYGVRSSDELKKLIEKGILPEHPTWEDYIELTGIEESLEQI